MYLLILIFPILGFLFSGFFGHYFGNKGGAYLSTISLFLSLILALFLFYEICLCKSIVSIKLFN
jgi:NADH:ubiquinone oxidoreductase subunit 5 (subunit L)/multisubunit Na+/H+ antiporter MnhA subunit